MEDIIKTEVNKKYVGTFKKVSLVQFRKDMLSQFGAYLHSAYTNESAFNNFITEVYNNIKIPSRSTTGSAGYDFYLPYSVPINRRANSIIIPTGIKCEISQGWMLDLLPRSSAGIKYGFRLRNTVGVIESDYYNNKDNEGHIMIACQMDGYPIHECKCDQKTSRKHNSNWFFSSVLEANSRVCQGIFIPYGIATNDQENNKIKERDGGLGSTGN